MKKILFAFSILTFILTSCSDSNESKEKQDNSPKNNTEKTIDKEEVIFENAATEIVYELAAFLYKDGLIIKKDSLSKGERERLKEGFDNIDDDSSTNIFKIDTIVKILGEEPLELDESKKLIEQKKAKIKTCKSMENLKILSKEIEDKLGGKDFRKDKSINLARYKLYNEDFLVKIDSVISKTESLSNSIDENHLNDSDSITQSQESELPIPIWLYVIPAILFVLLAAAIYFIKMIYDSIERLKTKREHDKQKFNDLKYNHDRLYNKVAVIDIDAVRNEMYEQLNVLAGRINDTQSEQVRDIRSAPQAKPEPKIFYAQYPDSADPVGFKNIQFESNSKMVYIITRIEGNKARFNIQNDDNTQQYAIGNHGKILKPVCEYLNQPSSINRTIKVFREGRLEMQNNIWIVVEKLKIKFE